ncbi:diacylglycerol kinase [Streptomyces viridochromogenes]|uniref:Diacylglycerol kinase n=1 Tax=Streptomyces viridochromogenes TaxID=1938 RepID=A0A0J7ZKG8_STRVR|nr:diacylglycerol kinase family protein [Streptomyces viridochromogenes]KMS75633.1 diacylglycerol kinase [Streptomyces viridochromogenes]KOG10756.1 diacylglycerol kinase [Streptomyces viridochromogenes]KOG12909.1 diacylglycerol kinase [Streptomyces viridochromogenes]
MALDLSGRAYRAQRWAARTALAAAGLAVLVPLAYGGVGGALLLVAGAAGLGLSAIAVWWTLTLRGPLRWAAAVVALALPAALVALFAATLFWALLASVALWAVAVWSGRYALRGTGSSRVRVMRERKASPPRRPYLIMNPRSGGGKVVRFALQEKAERLGARVILLDPDEHQDVTALARKAVDEGADLLGVAGGDGTQALVAAVAAAYDIPFLVISAGTRNHFAMDLGLDREDPSACLDALTDGVELRVDLGYAGGRAFVNNASFGAYAAIVQSPGYRDDKIGTSLELLPGLLTRQQGPRLTARAADKTLDAPHAVLVSNNPYRTDDPFGLGRRDRLDAAVLGVLGIRVDNAAEAAGLLLDPAPGGLTILTAPEVVIEADRAEIEAGIDGEALVLPAPVHCRIAPGALRVRVPRKRPGTPQPVPRLDWRRLRKLAATVGRTAVHHRSRTV